MSRTLKLGEEIERKTRAKDESERRQERQSIDEEDEIARRHKTVER